MTKKKESEGTEEKAKATSSDILSHKDDMLPRLQRHTSTVPHLLHQSSTNSAPAEPPTPQGA